MIIGCPNFINRNIMEHIIKWYNNATEYTLCIMLLLNLFIQLMSVIFVYHGEYLTVLQPTAVDQLFVVGGGDDWLRKTGYRNRYHFRNQNKLYVEKYIQL
jgi:hypothetical protein